MDKAMSRQIKAISIGVLLVIVGATSALTASAETGGHFISDAAHTKVIALENETHRSEMTIPGLNGLTCNITNGEATVTGTTVTEVTATGQASGCQTTGGTPGETTVHKSGCWAIAKIGKNSLKDNTASLGCPPGKTVLITHGTCTISIPPQTGTGGGTYKTIIENGKHAITGEVTISGTIHFESGFCVLLGTTKVGTITGLGIIRGFNQEEQQINITATGSEG
jgi:hypothetical protein